MARLRPPDASSRWPEMRSSHLPPHKNSISSKLRKSAVAWIASQAMRSACCNAHGKTTCLYWNVLPVPRKLIAERFCKLRLPWKHRSTEAAIFAQRLRGLPDIPDQYSCSAQLFP